MIKWGVSKKCKMISYLKINLYLMYLYRVHIINRMKESSQSAQWILRLHWRKFNVSSWLKKKIKIQHTSNERKLLQSDKSQICTKKSSYLWIQQCNNSVYIFSSCRMKFYVVISNTGTKLLWGRQRNSALGKSSWSTSIYL